MSNAAAESPSVNAPRTARAITRLAPSPTGTLHLGNARTFLVNWALARINDWRVVLRIEDLDVTRVREGAADEAISLLRWLGIDWDDGPFVQSHDLDPYRDAMRTLTRAHLAYSCPMTRRQIEHAASAPHSGQGEVRFPPELRPSDEERWRFDRIDVNYRFVASPSTIEIADEFAGRATFQPWAECGDFIIWTRLGVPAYQLAVMVDDARQGVTDVVRGDDLLPSAARQTLLYHALGFGPPRWWHLPLVLDANGRRLAKRDHDSHLARCRETGVPAERVIGLVAAWCGIGDRASPTLMNAAEFRARLRLDMLSHDPVRFTADDHAWLTGGSS